MAIALYYSVLIAAEIGSIVYLLKGVKMWMQLKTAQEDQPALKTIALLIISIGAFGTLLWGTTVIVSIYNHLLAS
jgi:hypothetical protein